MIVKALHNLCYKSGLGLGNLVPHYFSNISFHSLFYVLHSSHSGFLVVSSGQADIIRAPGPLHLLFLSLQRYLPRAGSFLTFEAQLKCHLFKEVSPTQPEGAVGNVTQR